MKKAEAEADQAAFEAARAATAAATMHEKRKAELAKLQVEADKLNQELANLAPGNAAWISFAGSLLAAAITVIGVYFTAVSGIRQALGNRVGTLDLKLCEQRTEAYRLLLRATEPLATQLDSPPLRREQCTRMAAELRRQYYAGSGLLLGDGARRWWSCLVNMLVKAGTKTEGELCVPEDAKAYAAECGETKLKDHRKCLKLVRAYWPLTTGQELSQCYAHQPCTCKANEQVCATKKVQDYVYLQFAASRFRTELVKDLHSRRPIADLTAATTKRW